MPSCVACQRAVLNALRAQLSFFLRGRPVVAGCWLLAAAPPSGFSSLCRWTNGYRNNGI
uniref:Uncharacterized protein n=1 Tax=Fagus sylvatica TaxID=28930 RepID=A0A2N9HH86_FAGSY